MVAAALAAVPLIALVAFSSFERYGADRERARTRATNRAELFATLLAEDGTRRVPTRARLQELMALNDLPAGSVTVVYRDGAEARRAGPATGGPPLGEDAAAAAIERRRGVFTTDGPDGTSRVWGVRRVGDGPLTVVFGIPGSAIYGPTRDALQRDLLLAVAAALAALAAAFLLAGRVTAPIRRLALGLGGGDGDNEIGRIESRFSALGARAEADATELARRAERIAALRAIDRAILDADSPEEIARAALGRLRALLGATLAEVVLFDRDRRTATVLVVDTDGPEEHGSGEMALDTDLFGLEALAGNSPTVHADLATLGERSARSRELQARGVRGYACVPLIAEGRLLGAVGTGFAGTGAPPEPALTVTAEVADQIALALRHARLRAELQAVVDAALDGIVVLDDDRRLLSASHAARELFAGPDGREADLVGRLLDDVAEFSPTLADAATFLDGGTLEGIFTVGLPSGDTRQVELRGRANFQPGRTLLVVRDVTERRRLEDQLRQAQKMEAVGQLAGGVAHDFNNLLTVISGYGEIARRRIGTGPGASELDEIARAADRASQLTRQLLAFCRRQVLEPTLLDLNEVISSLLPMLGRLIGEDVEIAVLTDEELPPVLVDRAQLEQVVINLAVNARDAMPTGGTLTIETRAAELTERYTREHAGVFPGPYARLMVTDTGAGMDATRSSTSSSRSSPPRTSATAPASGWPWSTASSPSPAATSTSTPSPASARASRSTCPPRASAPGASRRPGPRRPSASPARRPCSCARTRTSCAT